MDLTPDEQAIAEIKAILEKHDLAGLVIVVGPDHAAFLRQIAPSWSCARMEQLPEGAAVRVRSKREDYGSLADQKKAVEQTAGMFLAFMNWMHETAEDMEAIVRMISRHYPDIRYWERR